MDLPIGSLAYFDGKNLVKGVHYTYKNKLDFATKQKEIIFYQQLANPENAIKVRLGVRLLENLYG